MAKLRHIIVELAHHFPFSLFGVAVGMIVTGLLTFFATLMSAEAMLATAAQELFHVLHPVHILFSAVASTAMFWKHEKRWFKAVVVGLLGSLSICGVSDVLIPFFGGMMLGQKMHMHICLISHPGLILPFAFLGVLAGLFMNKAVEHSTEYSHSAHVMVSSMASLLYLIAFGLQDWTHLAGGVFMVTIVAVMIPCCASDIAFPIVCAHRGCDHD